MPKATKKATAKKAVKTKATKSTKKKTSTKKKPASKSAKKTTKATKTATAVEEVVTDKVIAETPKEDRRGTERRESAVPVAVDRRKVQRRRQIDPTTCERDYSEDEIEFMRAMDEYKRAHGRMFPTCSEILEVIRALGYERLTKGNGIVIVNSPANEETNEEETFAEAAI